MSENSQNQPYSWLTLIDTIDSTNNYASRRVADVLAYHGEVIMAWEQTAGKGSRGRSWADEKGKSLLMSLILTTYIKDNSIFSVQLCVSLAVVKVLKSLYSDWQICIKWPNDIYINDKKAFGILIENSFRGSKWNSSVVGIGGNILQEEFDGENVQKATSLYKESNIKVDILTLVSLFRMEILESIELDYFEQVNQEHFQAQLRLYNMYLYKRNEVVRFTVSGDNTTVYSGEIIEVNEIGGIVLRDENEQDHSYLYGGISLKL